ncbi:hypothetical protein BHM03_00056762, partial [Ensete ventricosum]
VGAASCSQGSLQGAVGCRQAATHRHNSPQVATDRDSSPWRPPVGTFGYGQPVGVASCRAPTRVAAAASLGASRGGGAGCRGGCPLVGWLLTGKGSRRLCKGNGGGGSGDSGAMRVKEG